MMSCVLYIDDDYRRYQQIKRKFLLKSGFHLVYRLTY